MPRKKPNKVRLWVFTQFKRDAVDYAKLVETDKSTRYVCYGDEICPRTGRPHHQGFIYMHNEVGLKFVKRRLPGAHLEPALGSMEENEAYCSKDDYYHEFGDRPKQGFRTDLDEQKERILAGEISADEVALENPMFYHQYGRTLNKLEDIALRRRYRTWMTVGKWFTGPTGAGKSHAAFEGFNPTTHYVKPLADQWWDGYTGQEIVILNEFHGQIEFSELMALVDQWPESVKRRSREPAPFLAKEVRVASIRTPEQVYGDIDQGRGLDEFYRRFSVTNLKKRDFNEIDAEVV